MRSSLSRKIALFSSRVKSDDKKSKTERVVVTSPDKMADMPALMQRLHTKWEEYQDISRPAEALIDIVGAYFNLVAPYFNTATGDTSLTWKKLGALIASLGRDIANEESNRSDSKGDVDLIKAIEKYYQLWQKDLAEFAVVDLEHKEAINILQHQIEDINERITDVRSKQVLAELRSLKEYQQVHQQINEEIDKLDAAIATRDCFAAMFNCSNPQIKRLNEQISVLQERRNKFNTKEIDQLRDYLVKDLEIQIATKRAQQETLISNPPKKKEENENKYVQLSAKTKAAAFDAECKISQPLMLDFIRLYVLVKAIFDFLPVQDVVQVSEVASLADLKPLFQQLAADLKNNLQDFYCLAPGRFEYQYYADAYKKLKPVEQKMVLEEGAAQLALVKQIFPRFEGSVAILTPSPK